MAIPLAIPLALSAAGSIYNFFKGDQQEDRANELERGLERPAFEIPAAEKEALERARGRAGNIITKMPGQDAIEGTLDASTANILRTIERNVGGGPAALNAASRAYSQNLAEKTKLGVQGSQFAFNANQQNQQQLLSELHRMSDWEYQQFRWDKALPYENKAQAIASLRGSGMQNKGGAVQDLFGGLTNVTLMSYLKNSTPDWMNNLFGGAKTEGTTETAGETGLGTNQSTKDQELNITNKPDYEDRWGANPKYLPIMSKISSYGLPSR